MYTQDFKAESIIGNENNKTFTDNLDEESLILVFYDNIMGIVLFLYIGFLFSFSYFSLKTDVLASRIIESNDESNRKMSV